MDDADQTILFTLKLPPAEAWALAQFLKRAGHNDYRRLAASEDEADDMRAAGERLRRALVDHGYSPR